MTHINYIYQNPLKHLRPTEHLYDRLEQLHLDQMDFRVGGAIYRQFTKAIDALRKRLTALEKYNEPIRTKWEMLLDPFRRRQVLKELGGEAALLRWEARQKRFWKFGRQRRGAHKSLGRGGPPSRSSGIKTDSTGRFCLAPAIEPGDYERGYVHPNGEGPYPDPRPKARIQLMPEELRGDVLMGLGIRPNGEEFKPKALSGLSSPQREVKEKPPHNPHPEATRSVGTRPQRQRLRGVKAGIMGTTTTDPSRRGCAAPQDKGETGGSASCVGAGGNGAYAPRTTGTD